MEPLSAYNRIIYRSEIGKWEDKKNVYIYLPFCPALYIGLSVCIKVILLLDLHLINVGFFGLVYL